MSTRIGGKLAIPLVIAIVCMFAILATILATFLKAEQYPTECKDCEEKFESGYEAGYDAGYDAGYERGFYQGNLTGRDLGYLEGNRSGYDLGYLEGNETGYQLGYQDGYEQGFYEGNETGYNQGYAEGNQTGYDQGFYEGNQSGYSSGYAEGYADGYENGTCPSYGNGYYKLLLSNIYISHRHTSRTGWIYDLKYEDDGKYLNYSIEVDIDAWKQNYMFFYYQLSFLTRNYSSVKNISVLFKFKTNVTTTISFGYVDQVDGDLMELSNFLSNVTYDTYIFNVNISATDPSFVCDYNGQVTFFLLPLRNNTLELVKFSYDSSYAVLYIVGFPKEDIQTMSYWPIYGALVVGGVSIATIAVWKSVKNKP